MVWVKGGTFQQGAMPKRNEEGPPRTAKVDGFWIDQTEVTNASFARFIAATGYVTDAERPLDPKAYPGLTPAQLKPSSIVFVGAKDPSSADPSQWWQVVAGADWRHPDGPASSIRGKDSRPVVQVGFDDALAYARWAGRDLPTEAEWEYAAQGGQAGATYSWGNAPYSLEKPQANIWQGNFPTFDGGNDGYAARTAPVGCFPANGYGLYDMAGNVWEWTRDWYVPGLEAGSTSNPLGPNPQGSSDPGDPGVRRHVIKGGSYLCADNFCYRYRPAAREPGPPDTGAGHIGFRTVLRTK